MFNGEQRLRGVSYALSGYLCWLQASTKTPSCHFFTLFSFPSSVCVFALCRQSAVRLLIYSPPVPKHGGSKEAGAAPGFRWTF